MAKQITLFYSSGLSDAPGASVLTERSFHSYKAMSQYVRRHGIKDYSVYYKGSLMLLLGNRYYSVAFLMSRCSCALSSSPSDIHSLLSVG